MNELPPNTNTLQYQASLDITTPNASVYLQRLCRHFSRKVNAEWDETQGRVDFPVGRCLMQADESRLSFVCSSADQDQLNIHKGIIEGHIALITKREPVEVKWKELGRFL